MGNVSITLGSSFYSSGGDTINPKTWPVAPTGDGVSPGTGSGGTGGTGGTGGGASYDQATIDAITYFNNVLTQGYGDTDLTPSYLTAKAANQFIWGTTDPVGNNKTGYSTFVNNPTTVSYDAVNSIDINTVTGLDQTWKDATRSIPGWNQTNPGHVTDIWYSDGTTGSSVVGTYANSSMISNHGGQGYTMWQPLISITEDLALIIQYNYNDGFGGSPYNSNYVTNYYATIGQGSFDNFNSMGLTNGDMTININPDIQVSTLLKNIAMLYDNPSPTLDSMTQNNANSIFDYGDPSTGGYGADYDWAFGLIRITGYA